MVLMTNGINWSGAWTWPVPTQLIEGNLVNPLVSQEFHAPAHVGVDVMYRVAGKWVAPEGTPILAARDGTVWSTGETARGHNVVLDHGPPWATFYQHLTEVAVAKGQKVVAGQRIGTMGADPTDPEGLRHLHFETWYQGDGKHAVDPGKAMISWRRVTLA